MTARFLTEDGHDVVLAAQLGLSQASDEIILKTAQEQNRILVTRDRDYGNLVFVRGLGSGVIYLRMLPATAKTLHENLAQAIQRHSEAEFMGAFVVIEPDGYRFRKLTA